MDRTPLVRKVTPSVYVWKPTEEAKRVEAEIRQKGSTMALPHKFVHQKAVAAAKKLGVARPSQNFLRGLYEIQVGKYHGQTFRWLAENDMGYTTFLLCQVAVEGGNTGPGALNDNKRQLKWYLESFPDGRAALQQRQRELDKQKEIQQRKRLLQASPSSSTTSHATTSPEPAPDKKLQLERRPEGRDMDDSELLTQVETLEASQTLSQPDDKGTTAPSLAKQSETQTATATSPAGESRPLSQLRSVSSLLESFAQPEAFPLPPEWKKSIPDEDKKWISKAVCRYDARGKLEVQPAQLWYHPPQPHLIPSQCPSIDRYFAHSLFVWMPKLLWRVRLNCTDRDCRQELFRAGMHHVVRQVIAVDSFYLMVTERLQCGKCKAKYLGWSGAIVSQLDISRRVQFPVLLTYRYACDESVVSLLRSRGSGNSATQLQKKLEEQHCRKFLGQTAHYLADCNGFAESRLLTAPVFSKPLSPIPIPRAKWFQHVYCLDVTSHIDEVKASITSTFGRILKLDSTKKVVKKLSGAVRGMAAWATNVRNEDGQVLNSVLTCEEGHFGLKPMVDGLVSRYSSAEVSPQEALYVDRGCCDESFTSSLFRFVSTFGILCAVTLRDAQLMPISCTVCSWVACRNASSSGARRPAQA